MLPTPPAELSVLNLTSWTKKTLSRDRRRSRTGSYSFVIGKAQRLTLTCKRGVLKGGGKCLRFIMATSKYTSSLDFKRCYVMTEG